MNTMPEKYKKLLDSHKPSKEEKREARAAQRAERQEQADIKNVLRKAIRHTNKKNKVRAAPVKIISWGLQPDFIALAVAIILPAGIIDVILSIVNNKVGFGFTGAAFITAFIAFIVLLAGNLAFLHDMKYAGISFDKEKGTLTVSPRNEKSPKWVSWALFNRHYHNKFWCPPSKDTLSIREYLKEVKPDDTTVVIPMAVVSMSLLHEAVGMAVRHSAVSNNPKISTHLFIADTLFLNTLTKREWLRAKEIATVAAHHEVPLGRTYYATHLTAMPSGEFADTVDLPWDMAKQLSGF